MPKFIFKLCLLAGIVFPMSILKAQNQQLLSRTITIKLEGVRLSEALKSIEKQVGCSFVYSNQLLKTERKVNKTYQNESLYLVLQDLFSGYMLMFQEDGNHIYMRGEEQGSRRLVGFVRDEQGDPLVGATVSIPDLQQGAVTDANGKYLIEHLNPGKLNVEARSIGYRNQQKQINISSFRHTDSLHFNMQADQQQLDKVTVVGKTETQQLKESGFAVNAVDLKQYANSSADLNQVLSRTTGVKIRETGGLGSDYQFYINGLTGNHIRFFLDGIPLENLGNNFRLNNIPVNFAKRLEVYKGVVPIELGSDALGGAVNIVTDQSIHRFLDASYSYGSFNTHRATLNSRFVDSKSGIVVSFNGFYNYSDNNYWMRNNPEYNVMLEITENGRYVEKDRIRRFYDRYKSGMGNAEIGVSNKKWADLATIGINYSANNKQNQTGATINAVYGGFYTTDRNIMPLLRYKKQNFLLQHLDQYLEATLSFDKYWANDTAKYEYDWSGQWIQPLGTHQQQKMEYTIRALSIKDNWNYRLDKHSVFSLNYTLNRNQRTSYNHLFSDDNAVNLVPTNTVTKHVAGLAYQGNFLNDKLLATMMAKYYGLHITQVQDSLSPIPNNNGETVYQNVPGARSSDFHGYRSYAANARYLFAKNSGIKVSYERGFRLPMLDELFGDGVYVTPNANLLPENSDNYNAGFFLEWTIGKHLINLESNFYLRNAKDFIYNTPVSGRFVQYKNIGTVQIKGLDAEASYTYGQLFHLEANFSYQNAVDNNKYVGGSSDGPISITYMARIPNMPWMYGNLDFGIGKDNLLGENSRIEFNWYTQYTHWFYLSWSSLGAKNTKNIIPTQWIHSPGLTYSWKNGKYNVSFESLNITNTLAYDNFRLQKPGRSFQIKFRYFIMQ